MLLYAGKIIKMQVMKMRGSSLGKHIIKLIILVAFMLSLSACGPSSYSVKNTEITLKSNENAGFVIATVTQSGSTNKFMFPHMKLRRLNGTTFRTLAPAKGSRFLDDVFSFRAIRPYVVASMNRSASGGYAIIKLPPGDYVIYSFYGTKFLDGRRYEFIKPKSNIEIRFTVRKGEFKYIGNYNFHYSHGRRYRFSAVNAYRRDIPKLRDINTVYRNVAIIPIRRQGQSSRDAIDKDSRYFTD